MCVLYVSFGCLAMGSAVLFILRSRFILYSTGSGVNRMQIILSGFNVRLFCFEQAKTLCRYDFVFLDFIRACRYDGDVICVGHDLNRCIGWW